MKGSVRIPDGMVSMTTSDFKHSDSKDKGNNNTELWLVQVPRGFDMSALNGKLDPSVFSASASRTIKVKDEQNRKRKFQLNTFKDSAECKKMSALEAGVSGEITLGQEMQSMLVVTETTEAPRHSKLTPAPKERVPMPPGLKVRFTTFGTETPTPQSPKKSAPLSSEHLQHSESPSKKKSKKSKRVESELASDAICDAATDGSVLSQGSPKKSKRSANSLWREASEKSASDESSHVQVSPRKSKKRQREKSVTEDELTAAEELPPPKKKSKKSNKRESLSLSFQNEESGGSVDAESSSVHKHKKHKKRKSATSLNGDSFLLDRSGDSSHMIDDSAVNSSDSREKRKKKKSRKHAHT